MAITLADTDGRPAIPLANGMKMRVVTITGDTSYPTGGYAITAANLNLASITSISSVVSTGRICNWDAGNGKLMMYEDAGAAGAFREVPNTTNVSALPFRVLVVGT